jgi:hypothetical protein
MTERMRDGGGTPHIVPHEIGLRIPEVVKRRRLSPEHKATLIATHAGHPQKEETKEKIRQTMTNKRKRLETKMKLREIALTSEKAIAARAQLHKDQKGSKRIGKALDNIRAGVRERERMRRLKKAQIIFKAEDNQEQ